MSTHNQEPLYGAGMPGQAPAQQAPVGMPGQAPQGYPQQAAAPQGYPQQAAAPQAAPQGYPPQAAPQGYPQQAPAGYPPQPGAAALPNNFVDNNPTVAPAAPAQAAPQGYPGQVPAGYPQQAAAPQGYPGQAPAGYPAQAAPQGYPGQAAPQGYPGQAPAPGSSAPGYSNQPYVDNANLGIKSPTGHPFKEKFQGVGTLISYETKDSKKNNRYARGLINTTPNEPRSKNHNFMCFSKTSAHMLDMLNDPKYIGQCKLERDTDGSIKKKYIKIIFNGSWEIDEWQMNKNKEQADPSKHYEPVKLMIDDFWFEADTAFKQLAENYVPTPPPSPMDMLNGGMMGGMMGGAPQGYGAPQQAPQQLAPQGYPGQAPAGYPQGYPQQAAPAGYPGQAPAQAAPAGYPGQAPAAAQQQPQSPQGYPAGYPGA